MKQMYPVPKKCRNPLCGKELPHDHGRQDCNDKCKNAYFYQKGKAEKETIYSYEGVLKDNERHVKRFHDNTYFRRFGVSRAALEGEGINLEVCLNQEEHITTGGGILWFGHYGVELPKLKGGNYTLHVRTGDKVPQYKRRSHA